MVIRRDWENGEVLYAEDMNDTFNDFKTKFDLRAGTPGVNGELCYPIGAIVAWHKSLTGTPTLPSNWSECDGTVISDVESPLDGQTLPNLNGENRFLQGNSTSGNTGGADTHTHFVNSGGNIYERNSFFTRAQEPGINTGLATNIPPYMNIVWIMRIK